MQRETRANLIFLVIFLAISIPGAVMLFRKKLDPNAKPMYLPDPVRRTTAFIDPAAVPAGVQRVVPPLTAGWIASAAKERWGDGAEIRAAEGGPLMSERRMFQVVRAERGASGIRLGLLVWDDRVEANAGRLKLRIGSSADLASLDRVEALTLPPELKRELQEAGSPRPPAHAVWISAAAAGDIPAGQPARIELSYQGERMSLEDRAQLPPMSTPSER